MFKLNQSPAFWWPVKINVPVDNGEFFKASFDAEFKRLPMSGIEQMQEDVLRGRLTDREAAKQLIVNWRGVEDDGQAVSFSTAALERLLEVPNMAACVAAAYAEAISGQKRKN